MNMKKILVLLLTLTMLTGAFAPTLGVFAEELKAGASETQEKETIYYVSLGDSMSNGLGLSGYDETVHEGTTNKGTNGFLEVAPDAYPAQFAAWLAGYTDEITASSGGVKQFEGDKAIVNLTQLATSGARAEDILYMLLYNPETLDEANPTLSMLNFGTEDQGKADWWVKEEMLGNGDRWGTPHGGKENGSYYTEADLPYNQFVADTFQTAVKEADVISYSGANGNFGVFFVHRVLNIVGLGDEEALAKEREILSYMTYKNAIALLRSESQVNDKYLDEAIEYVDEVYASSIKYMEENKLPKDMMVEIANYLTYITASYLVTFDKTMNQIAKLNPDVDIIILPLINNATTFEFDFTYEGETRRINAGEMMDMLYGSINAYTALYTSLMQASGDSKDIQFYYAELPTDENGETIEVQTFVEVLEELYIPVPANVTEETYPANRLFCHNRFIGDIRGFIFPLLVGSEGVEFDEYDVMAYEIAKSNGPAEFIAYCSANAAKVEWITQYLGVIDAVMSALAGAPDLDIDELGLEDMSNVNVMTMVAPFLAELPDNIVGTAMWKMLEEEDENGKTVYEKFREDLIESTMESSFDAYYRSTVESMVTSQLAPLFADPQLIAFFELDPNASDLDKTLALIELDLAGDTRFDQLGHPVLVCGALTAYHNQIVEGINTEIVNGVDNELQNNSLLQSLMVAWCTPAAMDEELNKVGIINMLLSIYGRMKLNNGLSCHPSAIGHDTLTRSMAEAYDEDYTTVDETVENLKVLLEYLEKNPNLVYSYAFDKVVKTEYVDRVVTALDKTLAALDLAADNVGLLGLTPELEAEVLNEINASIATLDNLRTALVTGEIKSYDGLMNLIDELEADLDTHTANVKTLLAQAGYDVENVLAPVVMEALADAKVIFETEVAPALIDMAEEFAWVAVDFLLTNIDEIYYNFPSIANTVYAKALETAIMIQILVGGTVDYVVETAYDVYFIVYSAVIEYYDDVEAAIAETDAIIHELYTKIVLIDNRLGNPSKDFLNGKSVEEWANLFNSYYHKAEGNAEWALEQLDIIIPQLLAVADGEYEKAIVVFGAILEGLGYGYDNAEDVVIVAGQIFSYVYDFVVEDLTLEEIKRVCDGLVDTIADTYEDTKSVEAVGVAIYGYVLETFEDTFHGEYQITVDSLYVALGNATYGEELAGLLHLSDKYYNFGLSGDYADTLADADFVTVRIDNGEILDFAISQVTNFGTDLDWNKHLDAEGQAALENSLALAKNALLESGKADELAAAVNSLINDYIGEGVGLGFEINGELAASVLVYALESAIYAYADAIDRLEIVVDDVRTLAPNATVVITGVQNPLVGLDLSSFGIDLGEYSKYVDYAIDLFNAQLVAVAYVNENVIYVDSANASDIYAALTVTCAHVYTDCEDTTCDLCGEVRVAPGHKYGEWCVVKEAAEGVEGSEERTCSVCGHVEVRSIDALPAPIPEEDTPAPQPEPKKNHTGLVIGILVAVAAVAGVLVYRKKKANPAPSEEEKKETTETK